MNAIVPASPRQTAHRHQPNFLLLAAAAILTIGAAALAWVLASVAHLSQNVVVLTVMVLAFLASWHVTNHRSANVSGRHHRVTVVPARVRSY